MLSGPAGGARGARGRNPGLKEFVKPAPRLNATVSPDLLLTIFYPNSELHDLAVIIRGNSVLAAGCVLPMSEAIDRDQHLGSRHRAGLGISEQSDAITVIVSEETGGTGSYTSLTPPPGGLV